MSISCDHRAKDDIPGFQHIVALAAGKGAGVMTEGMMHLTPIELLADTDSEVYLFSTEPA